MSTGSGTVDMVVNQAESTARNAVRNATADVHRATSITGWAARMMAGLNPGGLEPARRHFAEGVCILTEAEVRAGCLDSGKVFIAEDGYVRRSPRQAIAVSPGYRRRWILRLLAGVAVAAAVVAVIAVLIRMRLIAL